MIKPLYKKQAGRPAKLRRLQHDELINPKGTKMSRHYVKVKCGRCGKEGHNQRSCIKLQEAAEQKKTKRNALPPKSNVDPTTMTAQSSQPMSTQQNPIAAQQSPLGGGAPVELAMIGGGGGAGLGVWNSADEER
ncbi:hypothetical protein L484_020674 [Morus notabilis]|uniref:CCHC-type domain-containing protein n=1 Tax=Morus notabilis TaxID=981085 RepID=W9R8C5_9ROSA|nr:hypothetical protein L484_020674 [Morus notabilis]